MTAPRFCLLALVLAATLATAHAQQPTASPLLSRLDHLVYATPDLNLGIETIEKVLGVRATPGGQHPGLGTRNALVALGPSSYLEIIGPDPEQPKPAGRRRFGIDELKAPRIVRWVAKSNQLETVAATAAQKGVKLGPVVPGSRRRPDGVVLSWRYTDPNVVEADGLIPFFIDWGTSPHPSATAARGATLISVHAEHPDAERTQKMLDALGLELQVQKGSAPAIIATIVGPRGRVELR
jgi:glyoxalase-like protein